MGLATQLKQLYNGRERVLVKAADETVNNSSTLQDDNELLFTVAANEKFQFEGMLVYLSGATPDFKFTFVGPAGAVGSFGMQGASGSFTGEEFGTALVQGGSTVRFMTRFWGAIANGATAGQCKLQWAQDTIDASDSILQAGSYMKYRKQV